MSNTVRKTDPSENRWWDTDRDRKKWYKPSSWFKTAMTRRRRAKSKDAFIHGREDPHFRKTDTWDWN